jgi:hypothetical protein
MAGLGRRCGGDVGVRVKYYGANNIASLGVSIAMRGVGPGGPCVTTSHAPAPARRRWRGAHAVCFRGLAHAPTCPEALAHYTRAASPTRQGAHSGADSHRTRSYRTDRTRWPPRIPATRLPWHATVAPPWDQPTIRPPGHCLARQPPTRSNRHPPQPETRQ